MNPSTLSPDELQAALTEARWVLDDGVRGYRSDAEKRLARAVLALAGDTSPRVTLARLTRQDFGDVGWALRTVFTCEFVTVPPSVVRPARRPLIGVTSEVDKAELCASPYLRAVRDRQAARALGERLFCHDEACNCPECR